MGLVKLYGGNILREFASDDTSGCYEVLPDTHLGLLYLLVRRTLCRSRISGPQARESNQFPFFAPRVCTSPSLSETHSCFLACTKKASRDSEITCYCRIDMLCLLGWSPLHSKTDALFGDRRGSSLTKPLTSEASLWNLLTCYGLSESC